MACNPGEVLFDVNSKGDLTHDEIWDDTILIQQYDEALARVQKKLQSRLGTTESEQSGITTCDSTKEDKNLKKKKKKKNRKRNDWHVGDFCRARFSEDGQLYEGTIRALHLERGKATVRYIGYNNEEDLSLKRLLNSKGQEARARQKEMVDDGMSELSDFGSSVMESDLQSDTDGELSSKRQHHPHMPGPQPHMMPPPSVGVAGTHFKPPPYLPDLPPPPALTMDMSDDPRTSEALHTMLMSWYMTGYHTGYYQGLRMADSQKQKKK